MQFERNSEPGAFCGVAIGVSMSKSFPLLFHSQMPHAVAFRFLSSQQSSKPRPQPESDAF
jgi:hypothetical protein